MKMSHPECGYIKHMKWQCAIGMHAVSSDMANLILLCYLGRECKEVFFFFYYYWIIASCEDDTQNKGMCHQASPAGFSLFEYCGLVITYLLWSN